MPDDLKTFIAKLEPARVYYSYKYYLRLRSVKNHVVFMFIENWR